VGTWNHEKSVYQSSRLSDRDSNWVLRQYSVHLLCCHCTSLISCFSMTRIGFHFPSIHFFRQFGRTLLTPLYVSEGRQLGAQSHALPCQFGRLPCRSFLRGLRY